MASRRMTPNPAPPSPTAPPPPPRPPLRSRRKSKSPSSRFTHSTAKRALDVDQIGPAPDAGDGRRTQKGPRDPRGSRDSGLDAKWGDVTSELRLRGGRTRSTVYQTSDLPSMVKTKRQAEQSGGPGRAEPSKVKATFV